MMEKLFSGKIWKLRDDIDTDIIIPTQYLAFPDMEKMKKHAFEPLRPELAAAIKPGDIIVGGKNFGCGSSREQAPEVLCALKIKCIIAKSFARIFFRNAINNGLLLIESKDIYDNCQEGDIITVHINERLEVGGKTYPIPTIPANLFKIIAAGGLVQSMKNRNKLS